MQNIRKWLEKLPPDIQQEVTDFAEFLLKKREKKTKRKPNFSWAGSLKDIGAKYSSVELQHKISEWRIGG